MVANSGEENSGVPTGAPERVGELRHPRAADHTVLLVEDLDEHRYLYATVLRLAGYRVLEAGDGERALALAREHLPSLILLDMGLPVLDGWQVIQLLRANPATQSIPVIAVTVHAFPWDANRALDLGCTLHMPKPVRPHDVLLAVHRVLGLIPNEAAT
jgi:two-component system cell cycle response regulator DivK